MNPPIKGRHTPFHRKQLHPRTRRPGTHHQRSSPHRIRHRPRSRQASTRQPSVPSRRPHQSYTLRPHNHSVINITRHRNFNTHRPYVKQPTHSHRHRRHISSPQPRHHSRHRHGSRLKRNRRSINSPRRRLIRPTTNGTHSHPSRRPRSKQSRHRNTRSRRHRPTTPSSTKRSITPRHINTRPIHTQQQRRPITRILHSQVVKQRPKHGSHRRRRPSRSSGPRRH